MILFLKSDLNLTYTVVKCLYMYFYIAYGWFNMAETCGRVRVLINDGRVRRSIIGVYIYTYLTV